MARILSQGCSKAGSHDVNAGELHANALEQKVTVLFSFDHGVNFSFYFLDPEGNACEAYWETGGRPGGNRPIDLGKPEPELLGLIAAR
ncbi:MAG: hypothetical protein M3082_06445 [Candidatus Dormibacteraeota bacterium]|nr:hypothetical protein [Candidatus Dormibacteraeota bacterium]